MLVEARVLSASGGLSLPLLIPVSVLLGSLCPPDPGRSHARLPIVLMSISLFASFCRS